MKPIAPQPAGCDPVAVMSGMRKLGSPSDGEHRAWSSAGETPLYASKSLPTGTASNTRQMSPQPVPTQYILATIANTADSAPQPVQATDTIDQRSKPPVPPRPAQLSGRGRVVPAKPPATTAPRQPEHSGPSDAMENGVPRRVSVCDYDSDTWPLGDSDDEQFIKPAAHCHFVPSDNTTPAAAQSTWQRCGSRLSE